MKRCFRTKLLFAVWLLCHLNGMAQSTETTSATIITGEVYVGYPDWSKLVWESTYNNPPDTISFTIHTTHSIPPMGLRLDMMASKKISIGLDVWYARTVMAGTAVNLVKDDSMSYNPTTGSYSVDRHKETAEFERTYRRINVLLKMKIHFANDDVLDPYIHGGIGVSAAKQFAVSSNRKAYFPDGIAFPLAFRAGAGLTVKITPQLGINGEIGIGGPLFTFGLTYTMAAKTRMLHSDQ